MSRRREYSDFKNIKWELNENSDGTFPISEVQLIILMDIRGELQRLNALLSCPNFQRIPQELRDIRLQTRKRKRAKKIMTIGKREPEGLPGVILPDGEQFDAIDWRTYSDTFVKKPVQVQALRLEVPVAIETLEGVMRGNVGDWLIRGEDGEFYLCKNEAFKKNYEKVK